METKNTPAPWTVLTYPDGSNYIPEIWRYSCGEISDNIRNTADARLAASAPVLLAALEHVARCGYDSAAEIIVQEAIATALHEPPNAGNQRGA